MDKKLEILKRRFERERKARIYAEDLLEDKARELYNINRHLETVVKNRTDSLERNLNRFSSLIDSLSGGILLEDENGRILQVNQQFCDIFNLTEAPENFIGFDFSDQTEILKMAASKPDIFVERINTLLDFKEIVQNDVIELKDGRTLERDYIPLLLRNNYAGHLWHYRDITDRIKFQNDLVNAQNKALAAHESEKSFLARMSHEIRTPLNAIIGMSYVLKDSELSEEQTEWLKTITASATLLQYLVNDILDLSKIEHGKLEVKAIKFDLKELINNVAKGMSSLVADGIELKIDISTEIDQWYVGDPNIIQQILNNLLSNAAKFTQQGQIGINVKVENASAILIEVWDTGIGIPKDAQKQIFEKYKQANLNVRQKGTGLGLTIVKELIALLNGNLDLHSQPGKGTKFEMVIPIKEAERIEKSGNDTALEEDCLENMHLLILEDNPYSIKYISNVLNRLEIRFDMAESVEEACWLIEQNDYKMGFIDLNLPDGKGTEVAELIRKTDSDIPLIALTASTLPHEIQDALDSGMNDYLSKPFTPNELFGIMKNYCKKVMMVESNQFYNLPLVEGLDNMKLKKLYGSDKAYMLDMFVGFKNDALGTILDFMNDPPSNIDSIKYWVHKLKPDFGYVGLTEIENKLSEIETMIANDQIDLADIMRKLNHIKLDLDEGIICIDKQIEMLQNKN